MNALLSCPFCGQEPEMIKVHDEYIALRDAEIQKYPIGIREWRCLMSTVFSIFSEGESVMYEARMVQLEYLLNHTRGERDGARGIPAQANNPAYLKGYAKEYESAEKQAGGQAIAELWHDMGVF
jgi:hypothetical protein